MEDHWIVFNFKTVIVIGHKITPFTQLYKTARCRNRSKGLELILEIGMSLNNARVLTVVGHSPYHQCDPDWHEHQSDQS